MNTCTIPVANSPNQTVKCSIPIDGTNKTLILDIRYNTISKYWTMAIKEDRTNKVLVDEIPLLLGDAPAGNLLEQYSYLQIGSATIVPVNPQTEEADDTNLGTQFYLVWGDTIE